MCILLVVELRHVVNVRTPSSVARLKTDARAKPYLKLVVASSHQTVNQVQSLDAMEIAKFSTCTQELGAGVNLTVVDAAQLQDETSRSSEEAPRGSRNRQYWSGA